MRVLHLYSGNLYGGVETLLVTLARYRHLCPEMEPEFALCFRGRLWDELASAGVPVYDLGNVRLSRPWTVWLARRRLASHLNRGKYAAVIAHCCWPLAVFGPMLRHKRVPVVYWAHDAGLTQTPVGARRPILERLARSAEVFLTVAISDYTKPFAAALFPSSPTNRYYSPVVLEPPANAERARAEARHEADTPADAVVIIQTSRLVPYKGQRLLLEALAPLANNPRWVCWQAGGPQQAGESEYLDELRSAAKHLGIGHRVRFLGERNDIPRLLAAADIHCQPNLRPELFGITFVEALAAGLPVVSTAIGGAKEILNGYGILVPPEDVHGLTEALRGLIDDPAERRRLGECGPQRAAELCGLSDTLPRFENLLRSHLTSR